MNTRTRHVATALYYDGGALTLRLLTDVLCAGAPQDEIYRVVAKWMKDDLYYQLPSCDHSSAAWELLAHFRDGHFEVEQTTEAAKLGTIVWRFERTPVEQAPESARTLVRDRSLWQRPAQGPSQ